MSASGPSEELTAAAFAATAWTCSHRPLLLGYVRRQLAGSDLELTNARVRLNRFAQQNGYRLGRVFVEPSLDSLTAFEALVEAVERYHVRAVVVPNLLHFAMLRPPLTIRAHFEYLTGARVLPAVKYLP